MTHPLAVWQARKGHTWGQVSRFTGVSLRTLERIRGGHRVTAETAIRLHRVTGLALEVFLVLEPERIPAPEYEPTKKLTVAECLQALERSRRHARESDAVDIDGTARGDAGDGTDGNAVGDSLGADVDRGSGALHQRHGAIADDLSSGRA